MSQSNDILNGVLVTMARSFLQYVAESFPWVRSDNESVGEQVLILAERQRQDVADIAELLIDREHFIDFGTFPTEYTDQQFLALGALFSGLQGSQDAVCAAISDSFNQLRVLGDESATSLIQAIEVRQKEAGHALSELSRELKTGATCGEAAR